MTGEGGMKRKVEREGDGAGTEKTTLPLLLWWIKLQTAVGAWKQDCAAA